MTAQSKIGIVTVLYNSGKVLYDFFTTLDLQTYRNFVLYVVDNASPDDSLAQAKELSTKVSFQTVIISEVQNWGVAKGNNIGIQQALNDECEYVLLSNNDVVLEPSTIENLYKGMLNMQATMAVPKIYFYGTNQIWAAGGVWEMLKGATEHLGLLEEDRGQWDKSVVTAYSPTCFMLINSRVFQRVGIMDETYFVYYDDTDFVWRATKEHAEKLVYIHTSRLWHKESISTGGWGSDFGLYYNNRNSIYFARKHFSVLRRLAVYGFFFSHYVLRKLFKMSAHQRSIVRKAYSDGLKMREHLK